MNSKKAYNKLVEGNLRFVNSTEINRNVGVSNNAVLVDNQNPFAVVLTCSDSRVGVGEIFDSKLGDLFVIKNAGNIAFKSAIASIEYAVSILNVRLILVLSHQNCGAVKYAKNKPESASEKEKNIMHLLEQIRTVISDNNDFSIDEITLENANYSAKCIVKNSIIIKEKVQNEKVKIITGYYHIETGKVNFKY